MPLLRHPVLSRFLLASLGCLCLDGAMLELFSAAGWEIHAARLAALCLSSVSLVVASRFLVSGQARMLATAKGQPVSLATVTGAGAVLSFAVFARLLHVMPQPVETFGRLAALGVGGLAGIACNLFLIGRLLPRDGTVGPQAGTSVRGLREILIWGLFALLMVGTSRLTMHLQELFRYPDLRFPLNPPDPDAWLRLVQVRQWITGSDFFDHGVAHTNAPFGGITTPWTRPMDMLVAFFYHLTPQRFGTDLRLMLAAAWIPVLLGFATLGALGKAAMQQFRHSQSLACVAALILTSVYDYLSPGNVDHHGLLATLWCGLMLLLLRNSLTAHGAAALGILMGIMMWISPEALILCGAVFTILGLREVFSQNSTFTLPVAAGAAALTITAALFIEMPATEALIRETQDSISIVHAVLFWTTTAATLLMMVLFRSLHGRPQRFFVACLLGAVTLLTEYACYPRFFLGPLADADPYIFQSFLPRVGEARPLFASAPDFAARAIMVPLLAMILIGFAFAQEKMRTARRQALITMSSLLLLTGGMTLIQARWGYYLQPVAALIVAVLLPGLATAARGDTGGWLRPVPRTYRTYIALVILALVSAMFVRVVEPPRSADSWCTIELRYVMQTQQLEKLLAPKDRVVFVPEDYGAEMQFFTPYQIIASNYHREAAGLRAMDKIRAAENEKALRSALQERRVSALLFCPAPRGKGIFRTDAEYPSWLTKISSLRFMGAAGVKPVLLRVKP